MCEERSSVPIQFDRRSVIGSQSGETSISYTWMPIANKCPPSSAKKNTVSNLVVREMQRSSGEMKEKRWRRRRRKEVRVPFFLHMKIDFEFLFFIFPGCSLTQNWRLGCVWGGKCWYRFSLKHNSSRPTTKRKWRFFNHSIIGKTRLTFGRSLNFPFKNSQTDWKKRVEISFFSSFRWFHFSSSFVRIWSMRSSFCFLHAANYSLWSWLGNIWKKLIVAWW